MSHNGRNRRRLIKLWLKNCECHWCKRPTVLCLPPPGVVGGMRHAPDFPARATIDHVHSRLSAERGKCDDVNTVLACFVCNQRRGREEEAALPVEELHRRSGRSPSVDS